MLFTASTVFDTVTKLENTDYIIGNISTFNFPSAHPFLVGESVTGTGAYSTAAGVIYDSTTTIAKVARTSTLDFSATILSLSNGATTATYTSVTSTHGLINDSIQRLYNRDAWLRENSAILSENETITGNWTINNGTVSTLKSTTATITNLISTTATVTNLKSTTATITNLDSTSILIGGTKIVDGAILSNTSDGSDSDAQYLCGGGAALVSRGAAIIAVGNEAVSDAGKAIIAAGDVSGGGIDFRTGNSQNRLTIDENGLSTFYGDSNINGNLVVGSTASSLISMVDSDEGTRSVYCNSNRIGFLNQVGAWGSYCNDDGSWTSDVALHSPTINATTGFSLGGEDLDLDTLLSSNHSLGEEGCYKLPGGFIAKWGYLYVGDIAGSPTGTMTYSVGQGGAFPNFNIGTTVGHYGNGVGSSFWITSRSTAGFSWQANESDSNTQNLYIFYLSIGN